MRTGGKEPRTANGTETRKKNKSIWFLWDFTLDFGRIFDEYWDRARIHSHTCSHYTIALRFTSFEIFPSDVAFGKWCRFALIYSCRIRSLSSVCSNKQSKNHLLTIRVNLHVYIFIIKPFELVTLLATTRKWMEISQYHTNNINVSTSRTKTTKELSQDFK